MANSPSSGPTTGPSIAELTASLRASELSPSDIVDQVLQRIDQRGQDGTWITVLDRADLMMRAKELEQHGDRSSLPLYGIPFGVKDSIDVAGVATTLACPDYAYVPAATAPVVSRLIEAGAIFVGKTNLDQFATGLNGTRTPYPLPRSVFGGNMISGGSSSGSALAVATGEVPFTVATDTAGSGRVPPALNGISRVQAIPRSDQHRRPGPGVPFTGLHQPDRGHRARPVDRVRPGGRDRRARSVHPAAAPRRTGSQVLSHRTAGYRRARVLR